MGDDEFDKAMHDADWGDVYERQVDRGALVDEILDRLDLAAGDSIVALGSGPGYPAIRLAERLAPGVVYAVDHNPGALRYCRRMAAERRVSTVSQVAADAQALGLRFDAPTAVLAGFVLHHVDDPARAIEQVARAVPGGSSLLVIEYHPGGDGSVGPPIDHRLSPSDLRGWLTDAGFRVETEGELPEEKYAVTARRT